MGKVGDKKAVSRLLLCELVGVYPSRHFKVRVELRLSRHLPSVDLFRPERVLPKVLPADSLDRVLLQASAEQVLKEHATGIDFRHRSFLNFLDQVFQPGR
jgi:hypothetical protein